MLPPQRALVKEEGSCPWLRMLSHHFPSTEPSFHCVYMFEVNRRRVAGAGGTCLELNLSLLPTWVPLAFQGEIYLLPLAVMYEGKGGSDQKGAISPASRPGIS